MALVCGERSTLNPNAPLFIPAAFRQVEDFSPKWWELVKTSTWFRDYWLSQNSEDDFEGNADADDYIANMLRGTFDLDIVEEFPTLEAQFDEMVLSSEGGGKTGWTPAPENGVEMDAKSLLKNLSVSRLPKERGPKSPVRPAKYLQKPAKYVNPKCSPRWIQQPR